MRNRKNLSKLPKTSTSAQGGDKPNGLPGWPGYRTREGRSGYDPIDTRTEAAHVSGAFIQQLFTGQLKIRNPVFLFLSGLVGIGLVVPVFLAIVELLNGNLLAWSGWIFLFVAGMVGFALLANFVKNLRRINHK
jgi:hypothetical protein